ncbi:helix-turn-helix domain-containing protein [Bailinhaonella thermotolerans]|uniref:AraC family transcriptional regulator n=1 Tax=Bailinhaonella thermotolerans TaxID=1070861 RepID=A0A3A4B0M4_9ACTN|nr:helix-turn-helix domain-containing protein [Bailinhaonella thermotolerans]RJL35275.1 AraC family transcriptional regulator [Bailinhaonella thermotolerans]
MSDPGSGIPLESPWPPLGEGAAHQVSDAHWYKIGYSSAPRNGSRGHALYPCGLAQVVIGLDGGPVYVGDGAVPFEAPFFGLRNRPLRIGVDGPMRGLGIHMTPWAAHAILRLPMNEVVNAAVELREVGGDFGARLVRALRGASSWPEAFALADRFLRKRMGPREPDPVACAWWLLAREAGRISVGDLVARTGVSERSLELRFRERVGMSPKASGRLLRLQRALRLLVGGRPGAQVATECGFYDQAHLIRDCTALMGRRPSWFSQADRRIRQHVEYFGFVQDWVARVADHGGGRSLPLAEHRRGTPCPNC